MVDKYSFNTRNNCTSKKDLIGRNTHTEREISQYHTSSSKTTSHNELAAFSQDYKFKVKTAYYRMVNSWVYMYTTIVANTISLADIDKVKHIT